VRLLAPLWSAATGRNDATIKAVEQLASQSPAPGRPSLGSVATRILIHAGFLVIAVGCFAAYEHFKVEGPSGVALAFLLAAAGFGFAPVRDLIRVVFAVEGKVLHLVHVLGGLALVGLPLAGVVSGAPVLTHAAMAPFAIMAAAQAVMHQDHPRNAKQAAALQRFAASLPEVAQFAGSKDLTSPENARRAVVVLSDIIAKAQALGETELEADPNFQSALRQVSTRFGANLGLDAVDLVLSRLAANPATAGPVPELRKELASARSVIAGAGSH
jgi:hypothetical protein